MWTNLASSVPYKSHEIIPVMPPKIVIESDESMSPPILEVTPKNIIIKPTDTVIVNSYIFPQIPITDLKHFDIISKNAVLLIENGQLMLKPLDNELIEMQFRTERVWIALIVTIIAWGMVLIFMLTQMIRKKKIS
jgi:hypothetical protein